MLEKIKNDIKDAMKAGEKHKVTTLRVLHSEIQKAEKAKLAELTEGEMIAVLSREIKCRKESIVEFEKGARADLVEKASDELKYLEVYLPKQLTEKEIDEEISKLIKELDAAGMKDFGRVMKEMMTRFVGMVDGKIINEKIKAKLSS
jgi:uncharacterized protein YqeY